MFLLLCVLVKRMEVGRVANSQRYCIVLLNHVMDAPYLPLWIQLHDSISLYPGV